MRKEFYDMKVRFIGVTVTILILFFILAPFQKFTISILEGYSGNPQLEKFLPDSFINRLKEWNFYINSQWYGKNFGQIIPIIGIIMAFPLFSREIENGTMAFLLVRRDRRLVFRDKFFTGLISLELILFLASLLPSVYSFILSKDYQHTVGFKLLVHSLFSGLLWYSITLLYSVIFNDQVKPLLAGLATLAITTVIGLLKPLRVLNTFTYSLGTSIFQNNSIDLKYTLGIIIVSILIVFVAYKVFLEKEI